MSNIALKVYWQNEPMSLNRKIDKAAIHVPFGVMITHPTGSVKSVNGKVGDVVLNAADVGADAAGSAEAVANILQSQITGLSDSKLDKVDYVQHFRGLFSSYAALVAAIPTAINGDYAHIDSGFDFDRMSAIWDGDELPNGAWKIQNVNIGANTDEVPEGSSNLYFTSTRAQQAALLALLTGLDTSIATPALSTDTIKQAIGKLQAQINAGSGSFNWVDVTTIAGTAMPSVGATLDLTRTKIYLAKKDGQLWIKGYFQLSANISSPYVGVVCRVTDLNWFIDDDYTVHPFPATWGLYHPISPTTCFIQLTVSTMDFVVRGNASSNTWTYTIPPTCIGKAK